MKAFSLSIGLVMMVALSGSAALAQTTCATRVVQATGPSALLEGSARSKARAAWSRRVSESKRLGPSYATWLRARNPHYTCTRAKKSYICTASAMPCRV